MRQRNKFLPSGTKTFYGTYKYSNDLFFVKFIYACIIYLKLCWYKNYYIIPLVMMV